MYWRICCVCRKHKYCDINGCCKGCIPEYNRTMQAIKNDQMRELLARRW